ncbi:uncharacterized [Tachysurus ichikawai]
MQIAALIAGAAQLREENQRRVHQQNSLCKTLEVLMDTNVAFADKEMEAHTSSVSSCKWQNLFPVKP